LDVYASCQHFPEKLLHGSRPVGIIHLGPRKAWSATGHFEKRHWNAISMKTHLAAAAAALVVCLFVAVPAGASVQFATTGSQVTLHDGPGQNGGIFFVDVAAVSSTTDAFNTTYNGGPSFFDFPTFCVEISENISLGSQYTVTSATATTTVASGKTLGSFAAWLYTQFVKPVLSADPGITAIAGWSGGDAGDANAIQYGIWKSMGWSDGPGILNGAAGRFGGQLGAYDGTFLQNLLNAYQLDVLWTGAVAADANWNRGTTFGSVRIMNLVGPGTSTANAQDQLVYLPPTGETPLPEPVSFFVWSTLAICCGSAGLRRRCD
jgi:hypothetical protein